MIQDAEFHDWLGKMMEKLNKLKNSSPNFPDTGESMSEKMDVTLRCAIEDFERRYNGMRPLVVLACRGAADEHWQIYHPAEFNKQGEPTPVFTIDKDGVGYEHV